jgi:archaellum component FlaC
MSVEKVDGVSTIKGDIANTVVENVFYDEETGIVLTSDEETYISPVSGNEMKNIGFVEKNDSDKAHMIKFLVDSAKGINTSKINKEVNPMSEDTTVLDATTAEETTEVSAEVAPEAQPTEAAEAVVEAEAPVAEAEKSDSVVEDSATSSVEDAIQTPEEPAAEDAEKADEVIANAIAEIKESVTNAFGDLTATIKSLSDEVANMKKSLDATTTDVNQIKGTFNEIGKRVDSVEKDTAFRKSGDLGEIVQELDSTPIQKSLWGGRFLKFSDLYN